MPKKLTILGALMALVLGAVGVMRDGNAAFAAPVQNFNANATICYGSAPGPGSFVCPGASGTTATASSSATQYTLINLPSGSRLTLPIVYTPASFTFAGGAGAIGNVTSATDLLCNSGVEDILASGSDPGDPAPDPPPGHPIATDPWPDSTNWVPYDFVHQGVAPAGADAYVTSIKPMPGTYTPLSHDRADLYTLWLNKSIPLFLPTLQGGPTPLNLVTEEVPSAYTGGTHTLNVAATLLAGNPGNPPNNSFTLCLDSPQNSMSSNTQTTTPGVAGLYPRFTAFTSDIDERDASVSRILDLNCVNVGGFGGADADNDCLADGDADDGAGIDGDGDFVPDGIEKLFGTDEADSDTDNDGATDFDEIFQFTNPHVSDTDGDGQLDKQEDNADENPGTITTIDDTTADDNCPSDSNGAQTNSDSAPDPNGTPSNDPTNPSQDTNGDACDTDDDNDGIADVAELALQIDAAPNFCVGSGGTPDPTDPLDSDTDDDLGLDGLECKYEADPTDSASKMGLQPQDNLGVQTVGTSDAQETFYRTGSINIPAGGQENNPDGDANTNPVNDQDSDNDKLLDGLEVKFYGTHPTNADTDRDGCGDGAEAASVNVDRNVSSIDLSQISQRFRTAGYDPAAEPNIVDYDFNRDAKVSSIDLGQVAQQFQNCPAQAGWTITRGNSGPLP